MDDGTGDGHLDVRILGPLEVRRGEVLLPLGGHRQQAVLACLVVSKGFAATTDRIADAIWGESPPPGYLTTLQTYVYHLREALEPGRARGAPAQVLATSAGGYRLVVPEESVDSRRFEQLVLQGQRLVVSNPERASALLGEALALWRDDPLPDFTDLEPVAREATRLDEMRQSALESWAQAELTLGHHAVLAPELGRLVAAYPLRERLHAQRMLALYRDGRQAEALAAFRQLRSSLDEELGIVPSSSLQQLHEQILRHDPTLDWRPDKNRPPETGTEPPERTGTHTRPVPRVPNAFPTKKHRGRRWTAVAAIIVVALGLLGYTVVRLLKADDVVPVPANAVAMLSPNGLDGEAVAMGGAEVALAEGAGSLWAVDSTANTLRRIDLETDKVIQTVHNMGGSPQAVAVSGNDVWVAGFDQGVVTRVNAQTNASLPPIQVGNEPAAIVASPDAVWVANSADNTVQRIDPNTNTPGPTIPVGDGPDGLALDGTTLWVANSRAASVTKLDIRTGEPMASDIPVGASPRGMTLTDSDVWVANEAGQSVTKISRDSLNPRTISVEDGPSSVVITDGDAWVNNAYSGSISRIDLESNTVRRIDLGSSPRALALANNRVWVATGAFGNVEHRGGSLVFSTIRKFRGPTLDPASAYVAPALSILRPVYDGLVAFRATNGLASQAVVPDLATRIPTPSDGGRTYVFTIRAGIRYWTGDEVRASDFVRGVRRALLGNGNPDLFRSIVGAPECIDAPRGPGSCALSGGVSADDGNRRLTIHLTQPDPDFLYKLTYLVKPAPSGSPLSDTKNDVVIPGTGPYRLSAVAPDGSFTLSRNDYFQQWSFAAQPQGYPDTIQYRVSPSKEQGISDVVAGTLDFFGVGPEDLAGLAGHTELVHRYAIPETDFVYLNSTIPPFNDRRARRALNFAVDRQEFVSLYGGDSSVADISCQMIPPGFPSYRRYCPYQTGNEPSGTYHGPDLTRAQQLVGESGTADVPIVVQSLKVETDYVKFPAYLADRLRAIGYTNVSVADIPEDVTSPSADYGYQIFTGQGWVADYPGAQTFYDLFTCGNVANASRYCNHDIDALALEAAAKAQTDPAGSLRSWVKVDHMLTDDAAFVTIGHRYAFELVSARIHNLELSPILGPVFSQAWLN